MTKSTAVNNYRCLVQVTDIREGTKLYRGEPADSGCDLIVLELTDGSSFDNGKPDENVQPNIKCSIIWP